MPARRTIPFWTARDVSTITTYEVPWIASPWVAEGSIVELVGRVKLAGKTTFLSWLVAAVLEGKQFLGYPTTKTPVLWLTEQSPTTFRQVLRRAGLIDREDLTIVFWSETLGVGWDEVAAQAAAEAERREARLMIVDTLGQFAGLRGDAENNSGDALAAIRPLQEATTIGIGSIVVRHERKGGGDIGESGRGSTAFAGAVDTIMTLQRQDGHGRDSVRLIKAVSRFDETPADLVIELAEGGYVSLGTSPDAIAQAARAAILEAVPNDAWRALALNDLLPQLPGAKRATTQRMVRDLVETGELRRVGAGVRRDPYRYYRADASTPVEEPEHDSFGRRLVLISGRMNPTNTKGEADWIHESPAISADPPGPEPAGQIEAESPSDPDGENGGPE
jgi:hypothetical protein